jgi:hypothetical protein
MKAISKRAAVVFGAAVESLKAAGGEHVRIDNNPTYQALVVEQIGAARLDPAGDRLPLYSFAHYGQQNGDAMRDPDVVMIDGGAHGFFPVSFRNDYIGLDLEHCDYNGSALRCVNVHGQAELAEFCDMWARNLKDQQCLGAPVAATVARGA